MPFGRAQRVLRNSRVPKEMPDIYCRNCEQKNLQVGGLRLHLAHNQNAESFYAVYLRNQMEPRESL